MTTLKHRGVEFFINDKCSGLGNNRPSPGVHFSRFFSLEEIEQSGPNFPDEQRIEIIKRAIDRLLAGNAVYKGDIRDRR